jgi:hypothetical protein
MAEDYKGNEPIILDISGRINMESEDEDQAPASGIYLNPEQDDRKIHKKGAMIDEKFPDITHFEVIRDIDDRSAFDKLYELTDRLSDIAEEDVEDDFEVYDELISYNGSSLILHIRIEDHALYEVFLTIENYQNDEPGGFSMNSGKRDYEDGILDKFVSYKKKEEANNARTLPLSFLDSYFKAYDIDDWINTVLRETSNESPIWPIHVEH